MQKRKPPLSVNSIRRYQVAANFKKTEEILAGTENKAPGFWKRLF
jgi:hypothetical protein